LIMRSVRTLLVGATLLALTTLAACGGGSGSSTGATPTQGGGGGASTGASTGGEPSNPPAATPTENPGGGGGGDVDSMVSALTPPNSSQISRTEAGGGVIITWDSTDSADSLKGFYESKIPGTGMHIISTTNAGGYYSWVFAESDSSSHGGSVTLGPSSTGGSGTSVILAFTTQ
jgi:hypothetical protein